MENKNQKHNNEFHEKNQQSQKDNNNVKKENLHEDQSDLNDANFDDGGKKNKLKNDIKKLNHLVDSLKNENNNKQAKIESLERQINLLNENFKSEVIKKASEAQTKLDEKIKEFQAKYETELKHAKKYALKSSAIELIDIVSNFELAVNSKVTNPEIANYLKGFQMFANMFKNYFQQNGITEIPVNLNDDFNAEVMQAFETQKVPNTQPNKVIKIIKKGYKLHDIVLVPATVIVSE